ncbi:MAG: DnaJ family domain-containing protein [Acidimicrobiia bacterium]|nr:DnaJ family domain-containing protein [Acidimicrobiia bacterium]
MLEPQEHFVDRIIREAMERGDFDHLPGQGKPIPGEGEVDGEGWWIRRWVQRNRIDGLQPEPED